MSTNQYPYVAHFLIPPGTHGDVLLTVRNQVTGKQMEVSIPVDLVSPDQIGSLMVELDMPDQVLVRPPTNKSSSANKSSTTLPISHFAPLGE